MTETTYSGSNRIVVDWDGTCVEEVWPDQGDWLAEKNGWDARRFMREMLDRGYEVMILSTRMAPRHIDEETKVPLTQRYAELRYIRKMLDDAGLSEVGIWRKPWKPGARFYIDDKAIRFDGSWKKVMRFVEISLSEDDRER